MLHHQKGITKKRERHYKESRIVMGVALIILGIIIIIVLCLVWPQYLFPRIFNSNLMFKLTIDFDDYATCTEDYDIFINNTEPVSSSLFSFYVYNITNPNSVIERGERPYLVEVGPFSYQMSRFKYDVSFDKYGPSTLSYKEYSTLTPVRSDNISCSRLYLEGASSCSSTECTCKNDEQVLTFVNPLFSKLLWNEGGSAIISQFSLEIFQNIKKLLENEFIDALRFAIIPRAMAEIASFRTLMLYQTLFITSYNQLLSDGYDKSSILNNISLPLSCGLATYGITNCPWNAFSAYITTAIENAPKAYNITLTPSELPYLLSLFDLSSSISIVNESIGLARWIGTCSEAGFIDSILVQNGVFISVSTDELSNIYNQMIVNLLNLPNSAYPLSIKQIAGAKTAIDGVCKYFRNEWFLKYSVAVFPLLAFEYANTSHAVPCSPSGQQCYWQWGFGSLLTQGLVKQMLDPSLKTEFNMNSLYIDENAARRFNVHTYCSSIKHYLLNDSSRSCLNKEYTAKDATRIEPAILWSQQTAAQVQDTNDILHQYDQLSSDIKDIYENMACNLSYSIFNRYVRLTSFNDDYLIKFINRNQPSQLNHTFSTDNFMELGWAQFGSGAITKAVHQVWTIAQITRNGMWDFGQADYLANFMEVSSWAISQGFGQIKIYDIYKSRDLLYTLACDTSECTNLRESISITSTTFVGDGSRVINGVGAVGEITFIAENYFTKFQCDTQFTDVCNLLNQKYVSSYSECQKISQLYFDCIDQVFYKNYWASKCNLFETTITNPSFGIPCDADAVLNEKHPYDKSLGNVVNRMMTSLTVILVMQNGLVCDRSLATSCSFNLGGAFISKTVKDLLFDGFTDPLVTKYLNMKHRKQNISFQCIDTPTTECGAPIYSCGSGGLKMSWSKGTIDLSNYNESMIRFASYFFFDDTDNFFLDDNITESYKTKVMNPIFAAYPGWTSTDADFLRRYQCQGRVLFGSKDKFRSCEITVDSGRKDETQLGNIISFMGNSTIDAINTTFPASGSIDVNEQHSPLLWDAIKNYPFLYKLDQQGQLFNRQSNPVLFDRYSSIKFEYTQSQIIHRLRTLSFQPQIVYNDSNVRGSLSVHRFTEDSITWQKIQGEYSNDYYGMPYKIPVATASLKHLAGFPAFIGTPNNFGNMMWGGFEYDEVAGIQNSVSEHFRSFVDMDGISGRAYRKATRKQVILRLERGPILENLVSSVGRCSVPTKTYARGSGYGCSLYTPLLWTEEARIIPKDEFVNFQENFYSGPEKGYQILYFGAIISSVIIFVGSALYLYEDYHRRKFYRRIYID